MEHFCGTVYKPFIHSILGSSLLYSETARFSACYETENFENDEVIFIVGGMFSVAAPLHDFFW